MVQACCTLPSPSTLGTVTASLLPVDGPLASPPPRLPTAQPAPLTVGLCEAVPRDVALPSQDLLALVQRGKQLAKGCSSREIKSAEQWRADQPVTCTDGKRLCTTVARCASPCSYASWLVAKPQRYTPAGQEVGSALSHGSIHVSLGAALRPAPCCSWCANTWRAAPLLFPAPLLMLG